MTAHRHLVLFAVAFALLVAHVQARADERAPAGVDNRYRAIDSALARGEGSARRWWYVWTLGYAGLTASEGTLALLAKDKGARVDAIVGGAGSLLGLGGMLISSRAAFTARATLAEMDASTPAARVLRLKKAEELLEEAADAERLQHSVWAHLSAATVNLTGTFVLWLGYQRYASGWLNLIAGTTLSELQIITQPTDAIRAWDDYRAGRIGSRARRTPPLGSWSIAPLAWGLSVRRAF